MILMSCPTLSFVIVGHDPTIRNAARITGAVREHTSPELRGGLAGVRVKPEDDEGEMKHRDEVNAETDGSSEGYAPSSPSSLSGMTRQSATPPASQEQCGNTPLPNCAEALRVSGSSPKTTRGR